MGQTDGRTDGVLCIMRASPSGETVGLMLVVAECAEIIIWGWPPAIFTTTETVIFCLTMRYVLSCSEWTLWLLTVCRRRNLWTENWFQKMFYSVVVVSLRSQQPDCGGSTSGRSVCARWRLRIWNRKRVRRQCVVGVRTRHCNHNQLSTRRSWYVVSIIIWRQNVKNWFCDTSRRN